MERSQVISIGFIAGAVLILFCFPLYYSYIIPSDYHGLRLDSSVTRPDFELADLNQAPVRLTDLKGSYLYIFFGYSKCNGICPRALGQLYTFARTAAKTATGSADPSISNEHAGTQINPAVNFRVLFLSIDPARDDPPHLRAFFSDFGRHFLALRDGRERVAEVARRFGIQYSLPAMKATKTGDYQIDHPELVYVLDPDGTPVLLYTDVNSEDMLADWRTLQLKDNKD